MSTEPGEPERDAGESHRSMAHARARVADILAAAGDHSDALRIREHEVLPAYRRLGDARQVAAVLGKIADDLIDGDHGPDTIRPIEEERLGLARARHRRWEIANSLWRLAQLDLIQNRPDDALPRMMEAFEIAQDIGHDEVIATVGRAIGRLFHARGQADDARIIFWIAARAFRRLRREADAQELDPA